MVLVQMPADRVRAGVEPLLDQLLRSRSTSSTTSGRIAVGDECARRDIRHAQRRSAQLCACLETHHADVLKLDTAEGTMSELQSCLELPIRGASGGARLKSWVTRVKADARIATPSRSPEITAA